MKEDLDLQASRLQRARSLTETTHPLAVLNREQRARREVLQGLLRDLEARAGNFREINHGMWARGAPRTVR